VPYKDNLEMINKPQCTNKETTKATKSSKKINNKLNPANMKIKTVESSEYENHSN